MSARGNLWYRRIDNLLGPPLVSLLSFLRKRVESLPPVKRVLFVKLGAIGDTLLIDGVARAFLSLHPDAEIHFLTTNANFEMAERLPWVRKILLFQLSRSLINPMYVVSWLKKARRVTYDYIFDFEQWSYLDSILVALLRGRVKVGFKIPGRIKDRLFHIPIRHLREVHEMENFRRILEPVGLKRWMDPLFPVHRSERERISSILEGSKSPIVVLHPCCGGFKGYLREWPLENYARLARDILKKFPSATFIITGSQEERMKAERLKREIGERALVLAGELSLGETGAILEKADLFVSGNTGTMHVAAALKIPQVAIHGPTDPRRFGPLNEKAVVVMSKDPKSPCLYLGFEYENCSENSMSLVDYKEVLGASLEILEKVLSDEVE